MSNTTSRRVRALGTILAGVTAALSTPPALTASPVLCPGHWRHVSSDGPSKRGNEAVAYDEARKRVVLFGGLNRSNHLGDTWEWDGRQWLLASESGPPARAFHSMAYDAQRKRVVVFGGQTEEHGDANDTWEWDGVSWQEAFDPNKLPSPRNGQGMAYDSLRNKLVMYGGDKTGGSGRADTWATEIPDWKRRLNAGGPGNRLVYHSMAFDLERGRVVQFSGECAAPDTWVWDGKAWSEVAGAQPTTQHFRPGLAYDSARHRTVLYASWLHCNGDLPKDTWEWDGADWQQVDTDGPDYPPEAGSVAYDRQRGEVVLFVQNKTWTWNGPTYRCDVQTPGDINCDGVIDKDDVGMVAAAAGHSACAADDTRDLNGDGRIDATDKAMVKSLCTFAHCGRSGAADDDDED